VTVVPGFVRNPAVLRVAQIAIGCVFLAAALGKIGDLAGFSLQIHNYHLAPTWGENLIAVVLPWIELVAGLALVVGVVPRAGAIVVLTLKLLFTVAEGAAWARGLNFECGCFGKADASRIGARKFLENVALTALAAVAALRARA
jgi:uncharacterized membrane protein YphA (DoxX/SURF4 family)